MSLSERVKRPVQCFIFLRDWMSLLKISLRKYFKAKSTSKKVIKIASTEVNLTATEKNKVIHALADDKETPSSLQSSTKSYEVAANCFYSLYR